jgi:hypothetical protein
VPGHGAAPEKPERVIRLEIKRFYRLRYGALVIDTEQGYRSPRCRQCGAWNGQGGTRVDRGMPDLVVLTDHGVRFVEVKSRKGRQRPEQRAFQEACERAGVPYILARSLEDVVRFEESWSTSRNAWASGSSPMAKTPGAAK